jgi:hypothetical protein
MIEPWKRGDFSMRGRGGSRASIQTWVVQRVGEFSREQSAYLDYHRANLFKHQLVGR